MKHMAAIAVCALLTGSVAADIAITEWMNDGDNSDDYIELFNYSSSSVNLGGWRIEDLDRDEDDDDVTIFGDITIESGGYMIIVFGEADDFISEWGVGDHGVNLFSMSGPKLTRETGLTLKDDLGTDVWSIQYDYDDYNDDGFATWLTDSSFADNNYGASEAGVFVNPDGYDLVQGASDWLGYELGSYTMDPDAWISDNGNIGSPLAGDYTVVPSPATFALFGLFGNAMRRRRG